MKTQAQTNIYDRIHEDVSCKYVRIGYDLTCTQSVSHGRKHCDAAAVTSKKIENALTLKRIACTQVSPNFHFSDRNKRE